MFKQNEGVLDRIVRGTLGIMLLPVGLFWLKGLKGRKLGLLSAGLGVMGLVTGFTGVSTLYIPFRFSTIGKEKALCAKCAGKMVDCQDGPSSTSPMCCSEAQSSGKGCHQ